MKKETKIAYHEAGHVAASLYYRRRFKYVTIAPNDKFVAHVHSPYYSKKFDKIIKSESLTTSDEEFFKREMMILIAAAAVELKLSIKKISDDCENDFNSIGSICKALGIHDKSPIHYTVNLLQEAKILFTSQECWSFVTEMANLLIKEKTVKYKDCVALYDKICPNHKHF